ncbi:MAG: DUF2391 family protein [Thermomicrobiales bacterium]
MAGKGHHSRGIRRNQEWILEIDDAIRGLASGLLVGIPVVFTAESWWLGDQIDPLDALSLLATAYVLTLAAVYWINFRTDRRHGLQYFADAVEAVALAILALFIILLTLGQVGLGHATASSLGRVAVALTPVSLGIAVANHLLPKDASSLDPDAGDASALRGWSTRAGWRHSVLEFLAAGAGAMFLGMAIAPVDDFSEVITEVPVSQLPLVILLSLATSYAIVFAVGFSGQRRRRNNPGPLQHPVVETLTAYVIAILVAWFVLWLFERVNGDMAPLVIYAKVVLLAFPLAMGAAAGRLAV